MGRRTFVSKTTPTEKSTPENTSSELSNEKRGETPIRAGAYQSPSWQTEENWPLWGKHRYQNIPVGV